MSTLHTDPMPEHLPRSWSPKTTRSWPFYAMVTGAVTILVAGAVYAALTAYRNTLITKYTSDTPKTLELPTLSGEDRKALEGKWGQFYATLEKGQSASPLTLSPHELNVFISMIPPFKNRVVLDIKGDLIRAEFVTPLDELGLKGRYANGVALFALKIGPDGRLLLEPVSFTLNGRSPPKWVRSRLENRKDNEILGEVLMNANLEAHLRSVEIRDGQLVFTPKNRL